MYIKICYNNSIRFTTIITKILLFKKSALNQNDKEINPSYRVLRVSCKHALLFSACTY